MLLPLVLEDVHFHAGGKAILTGITARIRAGSRTLILGPNGAGKSVLMRLCHGLLRPTAGRIAWSGDPRPGGAVRGQAMVFQRPVLLRRSALDNIRYALHLAGVARAPAVVRAHEALATVGLDALADRPARVLSGGEQQRLALARAWALRPEVLFLDEPTASLDPHAASAVERIVQAFHTAGTTVVMSTHDLAQARRLADEVMFLNGGRLVEHGPAAEFFTAPATGSAARFIRGELTWD